MGRSQWESVPEAPEAAVDQGAVEGGEGGEGSVSMVVELVGEHAISRWSEAMGMLG